MLGLVISLGLAVSGQSPAKEDVKSKSTWLDVAREHVAKCDVSDPTDAERKFTMRPEPVFQHVQHVRGNATGSLFVWTEANGRPVAICDVFFLPKKGDTYTMYHEWHSLSSSGLSVKANESVQWRPSAPGLTWSEVPKSPAPTSTAVLRRRQLRKISERFTAHLVNKQGDRFELRRIATPIYQFSLEKNADSQGGGLFTFCQENDPELLLLLEARKTENGYRWQYAPGEYSNLSHFLHLDGREVWKADPPTFSSTGPHFGTPIGVVEIRAEKEAPQTP